jgi:CHAT domain-containing protein/tetratricopeptide (TPR) repeat protein
VKRLLVALLVLLLMFGGVAATPALADGNARPNDVPAAKAATLEVSEGLKLVKAGQVEEGARKMDDAIGRLEGNVGPDFPFVKGTRDLLVQVYTQLKQPEKAEAVRKRAERARQTYKPPASGSNAPAVQKLEASLVALQANDYVKAADLMQQALPDLEKSEGETTYLQFAGVLASLYDYSQQFAKGEAIRKDIIARFEKKEGPDGPNVAEQYESLATHFMMREDAQKALVAQKRAVEIARKKQPGSVVLVDRLMNLSNFHLDVGDSDAGQAALVEAFGIVKDMAPPDLLRMVRIGHALVRVHDFDSHVSEADRAAGVVCMVSKQSPSAEVTEEAESDCIRSAAARGDTREAGVIAAARFARIEKRHGSSGPFFAHAAHELALVRWAEGKKDEATDLARRAADAQEKLLVRLLDASGENQKRAQIRSLTAQTDDMLSMGGAGNGGGRAQVALALETVLRRKGRSLDAAQDAAHVVRLFDKADDKALATRQVEVRRQIAALGLRGSTAAAGGAAGGGGKGSGGAASLLPDPAALLARLEAEDDDLGNQLAAASPVYRAQSRAVTIAEIQATLPEDTALVEYVRYTPRDTSTARFAPKGLLFAAFVLHHTGDPVAIELGDALEIDKAVAELRKSLSQKGDVLPNAKRVHDLVFAPLRKHLKPSETRLVVSPDEDLNLVPYAALVDDRGRFLVQDFEITYVTSGRDLLRIKASAAQRSGNSKAVVLGDPAFDGAASAGGSPANAVVDGARGTRGALDNARFPALPGTAAEAKAISGVLGATLYTQSDATKAQLTGVSSPVVLHVATHGFFLTTEKEPPGAATRSLEYDPGDAVTPPPRTENPLVRSGLALAGANKKGSADGLLTALEASSMALDGTRLVVLSACETGVGQTEVGDGVYGLRRALVVAGSETQVMSLWKVDDDATRDLMIAFYKELKGGAGRAAALRKVQNAMLANRQTAHPYFWAAFIPSGAWGAMTFDLQAAPSSSGSSGTSAKDRPSSSDEDRRPDRHTSAGNLALGLHYLKLPNLRDQPDRTAALVSLGLEHDLLGNYIGRSDGFGFHDAYNLSVLVGARTSDAVKYADGDESTLSGGFRTGYEAALGVRAKSFSFFAGAQAMYTALLIGDARTYGLTLPIIALFDFRIGDETFVALRGSYGRFLVDQETIGGSIAIHFEETFLLAGVEQLKMPASVSLDGNESRDGAGRQITTLGTVAFGVRF